MKIVNDGKNSFLLCFEISKNEAKQQKLKDYSCHPSKFIIKIDNKNHMIEFLLRFK